MVTAGFPVASAGVFTAYYSNHPLFKDDRKYLAVIGTLGTVSADINAD